VAVGHRFLGESALLFRLATLWFSAIGRIYLVPLCALTPPAVAAPRNLRCCNVHVLLASCLPAIRRVPGDLQGYLLWMCAHKNITQYFEE